MGVGLPESACRGRLQTAAVLLRPKGVVVSDVGKGVRKGRQVRVEEMSESEPLMTHRKALDAVETGGEDNFRDEPESHLFTAQAAAGVKAASSRYWLRCGT